MMRKGKKKQKPLVIGSPYAVVHNAHVDVDLRWSGNPNELFDIISVLGEGSFGRVFSAIHKASGKKFAVKTVIVEGDAGTRSEKTDSRDIGEALMAEIDMLKRCKSPHVVSYYGSIINEHGPDGLRELWIIMEYCGLGSLRDLMERSEGTLTEEEIGIVCKYVLLGLAYLHGQDIVHRDIKAANILLSAEGEIKIADFGVSEQLESSVYGTRALVGTPLWMAPEVLQGKLKKKFAPQVDVWALGITAIELFDGQPPHAERSLALAMAIIKARDPPSVRNRSASRNFLDFLAHCLVKDPESRATVEDLLAHPFLSIGDSNTLKNLAARALEPKPAAGVFGFFRRGRKGSTAMASRDTDMRTFRGRRDTEGATNTAVELAGEDFGTMLVRTRAVGATGALSGWGTVVVHPALQTKRGTSFEVVMEDGESPRGASGKLKSMGLPKNQRSGRAGKRSVGVQTDLIEYVPKARPIWRDVVVAAIVAIAMSFCHWLFYSETCPAQRPSSWWG